MGYKESWVYIEPQRHFGKLIRAYDKAEQSGYYKVAGAEPRSVIILKQSFGSLPAGTRLLWVCGDCGFHNISGIFGGNLHYKGRLQIIPLESVLEGTADCRIEGIDLNGFHSSENKYMKRFSAANYAHRMRSGQIR